MRSSSGRGSRRHRRSSCWLATSRSPRDYQVLENVFKPLARKYRRIIYVSGNHENSGRPRQGPAGPPLTVNASEVSVDGRGVDGSVGTLADVSG
jgi:hypothetical protein